MEHHFNTNIAKKYGIEEAILLHHFYYWIAKNAANAKHFYDGLYWTYNSREAYAKFFGYINEAKIYRIIKKFVEEGLIAKGDYNTDKWKHTNWYALTIKGLEYLRENGYDMTPFGCVLQNADFDCCKMNNGLLQNEQSLYNDNIITDNNSTNNKEEEKELKEKANDEFVDKIYAMYPSKCPVRNTYLGKCAKDKDRIRKLLKSYSKEDIEKVVKKEIEEKYGKCYMSNFSTFLNNFPDPQSLFEEGISQECQETNNPYPQGYWQ